MVSLLVETAGALSFDVLIGFLTAMNGITRFNQRGKTLWPDWLWQHF